MIRNTHHSFSTTLIISRGKITFRTLQPSDSENFGAFLETLSEETKKRFQPHPLTKEMATQLCSSLDFKQAIRLVGFFERQIIVYVIMEFSFPEEKPRYKTYGIELNENYDCKIAIAVADAYQNVGVGSVVMQQSIEWAKQLGLRYMILSGGTQTTNARAVHLYEKLNFQKVGKYRRNGMNSYDMYLQVIQNKPNLKS